MVPHVFTPALAVLLLLCCLYALASAQTPLAPRANPTEEKEEKSVMLDPIITTLINFGIGGCMAALVVWHVWYTHTKTQPAMMTTFREQIAAERTASERNIAAERAASEERLKQERQLSDARLSSERQITQIRHEENIAQSTLIISSLRETHHAIANIANQVSLHHAKIDMVIGMRRDRDDEADLGSGVLRKGGTT